MNVRTLKRVSKRSVSMLLSVLMVISVFTVCMIGSTVSVSAYSVEWKATIYFDNSQTQWNNVYCCYGADSHNSYRALPMTRMTNTVSDIWYVYVGGSSSSSNMGWGNIQGIYFADSLQGTPSDDNVMSSTFSTDWSYTTNKTEIIQNVTLSSTSCVNLAIPTEKKSDGSWSTSFEENSSKADSSVYLEFDASGFGIPSTTNTIYMYYGGNANHKYQSKATLTRISGTDTFKSSGITNWNHMFGYYFSTEDNLQNGKSVIERYESDIGTKTKIITSKIINNLLVTVNEDGSITLGVYQDTNNYLYVNATLYNYRNQTQIIENSDWADGQATTPFDPKVYGDYNSAVADWYYDAKHNTDSEKNYYGYYYLSEAQINALEDTDIKKIMYNKTNFKPTPLYQGNFREWGNDQNAYGIKKKGTIGWVRGDNVTNNGSDDASNFGAGYYVHNLFYYFVSVANGTNRKDGADYANASTRAVAMGLVDDELSSTRQLVQNGAEVPQFSDKFMDTYNNPTDYRYVFSSNYKGIIANKNKNLGTIQTKYENLHFPFKITRKNATGGEANEWYSYEPSVDGNRYYDTDVKDFVIGSDIHSCANDAGSQGKIGYYPFNPTDPATTTGNDSKRSKIVNCFGTRFELKFYRPSSGEINGEALEFKFEGDDDVWVYIDNVLALDMGGAHNNAVGSLNLKTLTYSITTGAYKGTYKDNSNGDSQYNVGRDMDYGYNVENEALPDKLKALLKDSTREHTMTVFYLERGTFDSNFKMEFMLPQIDNTLILNQKVDTSNVNPGLKLDTAKVANEDVFTTSLSTKNMVAGNNNAVAFPVEKEFVRKDPDYQVKEDKEAGSGTSKILQKESSSSMPAGEKTVNNSVSYGTAVPATANYSWTDTSRLLDMYGNETNVYSAVDPDSSEGTLLSGVARPSTDGFIPLLYGQSVSFYNQFSQVSSSTQTGVYASIGVLESNDLSKFKNTYDTTYTTTGTGTGLIGTETPKSNGKAVRTVNEYYTTKTTVTGGSQRPTSTTTSFVFDTDDTATGNPAVTEFYPKSKNITITYEHKVKTGSFTLTKKLEQGEIEAVTEDTDDYIFIIQYKNLFGCGSTDWSFAEGLVGTRDDGSETNTGYSSADGDTSEAGRIGIKVNETVTFSGIPVGTIIKVTEISRKIGEDNSAVSRVEVRETDFNYTYKTNTEADNGTDDYDAYLRDSNGDRIVDTIKETYIPENTHDEEDTENPASKTVPAYERISTTSYKATNSDETGDTFYISMNGEEADTVDPDTGDVTATGAKIRYNTNTDCYVYNTYRTTPVLYRFVDRNIVNGKPTSMQSGYTYFVKHIPSQYTSLIDESGATPVLKDDGKKKIADNSPQVINVLRTYGLSFDKSKPSENKGTIQLVEVDEFDEEVQADKDAGKTTEQYESSMYALKDYNHFYEVKTQDTTKKYMIVATYADYERKYTIDVDYYKPSDGSSQHISFTEPFNGLANLGPQIGLDEACTDLREITVSDKTLNFAYWERQVTYFNGASIVSTWEPVSTNYNYHYRISADVNIRAVYKSSDNKRYVANAEDGNGVVDFEPIQYGKNNYSDYANDTEAYCVPNNAENPQIGFAASAIDRIYNSYSLETSKTETKKVNGVDTDVTTYDYQNRTRVDVIFGSVGSYDNDQKIENVGYVLFQNKGSYPSSSSVTTAVKNIIDLNLASVDNLPDDKTANGKVSVSRKKNTAYNPTDYACLFGKFTVIGNDYGEDEDTYEQLGQGKINLTNKNRVDIVFDLPNNENTQQYYYTCYTYMKRDGQIYVSEVPTTFNLKDADPNIKDDSAGKKPYFITLNSNIYDSTLAGSAKYTTTSAGNYGSMTCNYSIATDGRILSLRIKTGSATEGIQTYRGKLVAIKVGNTIYTADAGGTGVPKMIADSAYGGAVNVPFNVATDLGTINKSSTLDIIAYFQKEETGVIFTYTKPTINNATVKLFVNDVEIEQDEVLVQEGDKVKLVVTPNTNYEIGNKYNYTLDNKSAYLEQIVASDDNESRFANKFENYPEIKATTYTLTIKTTAGGAVRAVYNGTTTNIGANSSGTITITPATSNTVTLTASASTDYEFTKWSNNATVASNYSYTVTSTGEITAQFASTAKKLYFALIRQNYSNPYPRIPAGSAGIPSTAYGNPYYIDYADGVTMIDNSSATHWGVVWSNIYARITYTDNGTLNGAMTFEGIYNIKDIGKAVVFSITPDASKTVKTMQVDSNTLNQAWTSISNPTLNYVYYANGNMTNQSTKELGNSSTAFSNLTYVGDGT